jgi:hypothetical protein
MFHSADKRLQTAVVSVSAIVAATLAAALTLFSPEVKAEPTLAAVAQAKQTSVHAKADRLPLPRKGSACSAQGWPQYEQNCQFDIRRSSSEPRKVRIIALR